ncbi:condensin-2 complex subunit G2-like [Pollicipes pollicipes]|uniref:condensin-2 complex subunit G2-like n=1 Tax=Pollicipes pollicipes TaxID=41117 RepID=UPI001884BE34|nr:condensin-2 complex subunit G2-like [Pollicipes pollicipes]
MFHAVYADRQRSRLPRLLFQLLHYMHNQRRHRDTADMLVRLYQPILWRALTATHATVQLNATFLLLDTFPLEDPAACREERELELARQCRLITGLLRQSSHEVRVAAAKGVCKVLAQYWSIIPADDLKQMMKVLLQELAHDASSVEVRHQVVSGLCAVLDNPYTHNYMKSAAALPDGRLPRRAPVGAGRHV